MFTSRRDVFVDVSLVKNRIFFNLPPFPLNSIKIKRSMSYYESRTCVFLLLVRAIRSFSNNWHVCAHAYKKDPMLKR